jgi:uncharacterized membrane protein
MKRPVAVTIVAVIASVYGIFNLLLTFLGLVGIGLKASGVAALTARANSLDSGTLAYAAVWDVVLGLVFLAFGIGTLRRQGWAWTAGVAALVLEVVRNVIGFFISGLGPFAIITSVLALLLLVYLFLPNVRAAFRESA